MTGAQFVADANNATHNFTPSERKGRETTKCTDGKRHILSKPSDPGKTATLSFPVLQLCLWMWMPWRFIISVSAMFSPSSDSFMFSFWFSALSQTTGCLFLFLVSCALIFLLISSLNFWPSKTYIIQIETQFSEL